MLVLLALMGGCQCDDPGLGRSLPPGAIVETFAQAEVSRIDILWVVDNSRSMVEEQQNLSENLVSFFRFLDEGDVDYQIAVTTTDAVSGGGAFVGSPQILTPATSAVLESFQANIQVGTTGSALEQGLAASLAAFERNPGFLRPDAHLFVIFVSDEDDRSFGELRYYWRVFEQLKGVGNEEKVSLSAIVGPPNDETGAGGCQSENGLAEAGDRYVNLASETGGLWGSICDPSFATTLETLGGAAVGLKRKFFLANVPDPETLAITARYPCEGRPEHVGTCADVQDTCGDAGDSHRAWICTPPRGAPEGWIYESETNSIFFPGEGVPGLKAILEVTFMKPKRELEK